MIYLKHIFVYLYDNQRIKHKMNYKDKIVIVSGGEHGIGKAISQAFAREGARVIMAGLNEDAGKKTEKEITAKGETALFIKTDVRNESEIIHLYKTLNEQFGAVDILINNAGISKFISPYELSANDWDEVISTNLKGTFLMSREAARLMREKNGGAIVNIASTRAFMSEPNSEAYAASKGGIVALTHAMAASFAPDQIQVNCISPGWIETGDHETLKEIDHLQHFSGRVGNPDDIARACLFLCSRQNNFISGTNLTIDGGMTRKMIYEE